MRLNKYIQQSGISSRRKADLLIINGKIKVNDKIIYQPFYQVKQYDIVKFEDKIIKPITQKLYIKFYKPKGVTTTRKDKYAKKIIYDFLPEDIKNIVFPIGRLDKESEGLIILTNDGNLSYKYQHPKFKKEKQYLVNLDKKLSQDKIKYLIEKGILIDDKLIKPVKIYAITKYSKIYKKYKYINLSDKNLYLISITEGIKREIRKIFKNLSYKVLRLIRICIADICLYNLKEGQYQYINIKY